jgi:hypothetical protein
MHVKRNTLRAYNGFEFFGKRVSAMKTRRQNKGLSATAKAPLGQHINISGVTSPQTTQPGHHLTVKEVAARWHCCVHSVRRRRELRPIRFNQRMLRYRLADVEAIETAAQ